MTVIGIDPTVDYAFKRMLGSPEHTELTIHFLNSILGEPVRIKEVTILNPILDKEFSEDKLSVLDVRAIDESGRPFNIEMQTSWPRAMQQRLAFHVACLFSDSLRDGRAYSTLQPSICICVLSQMAYPQVPDLHLDFRLRECQYGLEFTDAMQIHLLELPIFLPTQFLLLQQESYK